MFKLIIHLKSPGSLQGKWLGVVIGDRLIKMTPNKSASRKRMCCMSCCIFLLKAVVRVSPFVRGMSQIISLGRKILFKPSMG